MVVQASRQDALIISKIHIKSLSDDFLPSLGIDFLRTIYEGILENENVFGFVDVENSKVRGFVIGTTDMNRFFRDALFANFFKAFYFLTLQFVKKPQIILKILETFLYPKKEIGPRAELIVIAVLDKYQGLGIGKNLVAKLEEKFKLKKIKKYKVTVHANKQAIYFYEKLGYKRVGKFELYSKDWCVYEKRLE